MPITKTGKNKFKITDDEKKETDTLLSSFVSSKKDKSVKNLTNSEKDDLLVILAQVCGISDSKGTINKHGK